MTKFDEEKLVKLNEKIKEYGFRSFEKFSLCPAEYGKPRTIGDFQFLLPKKDTWKEGFYVAYTGNEPELQFLKLDLSVRISYLIEKSIKFDNKIYNHAKTFMYYSRHTHIYTEKDFLYSFDSLYRIHTGKNINYKNIWAGEIAVNFKKACLQTKREWKEAKEKACKDVFNITVEELAKKQNEIDGVRDTDYILFISPKLRNLKADCELLLKELSENKKPSKKIKDRFYKSYQEFQNFDPKSNRKHITKIRSL